MLLLFLFIYRFLISLTVTTYHDPDEYWQSLEVAHSIVFKTGYLTWEWHEHVRSYLFPLLYAFAYKLSEFSFISLNFAPKLVQALITSLGDYFLYKLACRLFDRKCAKLTVNLFYFSFL